ncbi:tetratricopeptide repeat protein 37 [Galleria mellonella]|uniref:Tetratricopeptide repeat protein 37 n=1 Tax=Galleria mellonella TaxID=7137 RepID=A0A6J1WXY1_GALME|nr:tetratricopeptide repeat protein 37 [Galleria mellonella]
MADIKTLLKEAKKLIVENKFKEAQECCKNILRKDKQNYMGLVLLGKSLQDSDQAPLAYQKAISNKPDQPLAWQGLANYYEKNDDKLKLFSVYDEILKLQLEEDKTLEVIAKLGQLGCTLKNSESVRTFANYLNTNCNERLRLAAENQFINILKADVPCKEENISIILKVLDEIYKKDPNDELEILCGKVIIQQSDYISAFKEVINLKYFSSNVVLRELLCKHLCRIFVENKSFFGFDIDQYIDRITEGVENSNYPGLLRSMINFDKGYYLDAYKQCIPLINYNQADVTEATFIINCTIMLKKWSTTQKLVTNFLTKVKDQNFSVFLKKKLFLSLAKQKKWSHAIFTAQQISLDSLDTDEKAILAECYIESDESPDQIINLLQSTDYFSRLKAQVFLRQGKYADAIILLEENPNNYLNLFYLGKTYWDLKQYEKCLMNLLKSAKLNSEHGETFLYLGHVYNYRNDLLKAKKCYEKAHSLVNTDSECIKHLSETYIKLNMKEENFKLLTTAEHNIKINESWLNFRLGLHYLNIREWENAIVSFRNVIKSNKNDIIAFECLADAYYSRGSFTSALRAYNKVKTLDPSKTAHCLTRIGYIYTLLTQYEDAIDTFKKVLEINPYSLLSLKGIAETWIKIAKKKATAKLYGSARDCAQHAIEYVIRAIKQNQFLCLWKLLADTLMFITKLPSKYTYAYLKNTETNADSEKIEKNDILLKAIACYSHITKQKQQSASYDLASAYLAYYHETNKQADCKISFQLTLICIKENPTIWRNWNLLGKICLFIKKYDIAQHCFIKALSVTRKWSVAKIWSNLGTLYLKLKLHKLANYCFWRGQSTLPSHAQSWIGQGLIAEAIREEEAMDLFRHASRLGYHPESALGYADWVCRTLKKNKYKESPESRYEIDGLHAIPYAIDLVEWFSSFEPNDACACTILGILQERNGLLRAAYNSYQKALNYAEEGKKNITLLNLGRILLRLGKYDEAIKTYKAITEASLDSTCGLALALFKKASYEESYSVYDTALHWLSNEDDEKADLLVAMASIMYMFKGLDDAKTIVFHSIQISQKKPTANSLFAICSLGLLHSDQSLTKLALHELQKYENQSDYGFDIGFLKSYLLVCENNIDQAIKLLSDSLHDHPSNALLWYFMSEYCLRASNTKAKAASNCAQKALCSARYSEQYCDPAKMIAMASIAEHIAGDHTKALLLAKEGLHIYPQQCEIWAALLFALLSHKMWINQKDWILGAANHMRRHLDITRPLSRWISLLEKKVGK